MLYNRKWRILIYAKPDDPEAAFEITDLRCIFTVKRSTVNPVTTVDLEIYNLNPETEGTIIKSGYAVIVEAGYENGPYGKICDADIAQVFQTRENGTDYKLTIVALEGSELLNAGFIRSTIAANSTPRQIIEVAAMWAADGKIELGTISDNLLKTKLPRGKVCFGTRRDILHNIIEGNQAVMYMGADRKLNIVKPSDSIPEDMTVVLTPTTGLVETPEYTDQGIYISSLLNPSIAPNTLVKIDNSLIRLQKVAIQLPDPNAKQQTAKMMPQESQLDKDGEYQAFTVQHTGDTWGNEWRTSIMGIGRNGRSGMLINVDGSQQDPKG